MTAKIHNKETVTASKHATTASPQSELKAHNKPLPEAKTTASPKSGSKGIMKGAGKMLGRGWAGTKKKANEYGVGKSFRKGKKGIYKRAGVSEGAGDVLTKGAAAIGVSVMAVAAIPTLVVGGAVGGGAYMVGQKHAPDATNKVVGGLSSAAGSASSAAGNLYAGASRGMKESRKTKKATPSTKLYGYDPIQDWDGKFTTGMAVLSKVPLNSNGRDAKVYEGEIAIEEGVVHILEAVKLAENNMVDYTQKIKLTILETQQKRWLPGSTFVPVEVYAFNKYHNVPFIE